MIKVFLNDDLLAKHLALQILKQLKINIPNKLLLIAEAFRKKIPLQKIYKLSKVDPWFLKEFFF